MIQMMTHSEYMDKDTCFSIFKTSMLLHL